MLRKWSSFMMLDDDGDRYRDGNGEIMLFSVCSKDLLYNLYN